MLGILQIITIGTIIANKMAKIGAKIVNEFVFKVIWSKLRIKPD